MDEFIASSGLIIIEIAIVLTLVMVTVGVIVLRKRRAKESEAKKFVKKINAGVHKRKEKHLNFARVSMIDFIDGDDEIAVIVEELLEEHVSDVLEKENSLYGEFVKILTSAKGHSIETLEKRVEELINVCHIKVPKLNTDKSDSAQDDSVENVHEELIQTLKSDNEELRDQVEKLAADNEKVMSEYEIIYQKYEALTKHGAA